MSPRTYMRANGGPRDGDRIPIDAPPGWVKTLPVVLTMPLHPDPDWREGDDDHVPAADRIRALYRLEPGTLVLRFERMATFSEMADERARTGGVVVANTRSGR